MYSYRLIRVITEADIDLRRWEKTTKLSELPVSPEPELTPEERLWCGEREGNIGAGVALSIFTVAMGILAAKMVSRSDFDNGWIFVLAFLGAGFALLRYRWRPPLKMEAPRLAAVIEHKEKIRAEAIQRKKTARTEFEKALNSYSNWEKLTPEEFEHALSLRLRNDGCLDTRVTRHSKDGGIDIKANDPNGRPIIVQAKKYGGNVGVNVVREMIGVRAIRRDNAHIIIYSLVGFTKGAIELAAQEGVELRDIRNEMLRI